MPRIPAKSKASKNDRITTIQLNASTRDRLYQLKFRKTYDDYINYLMDLAERLENKGKRPRSEGKMEAMVSMTKAWAERNVRWGDGRIKEIDLDGE
jgi:hypothetical protein